MTIEIEKPELEALIQERLRSGAFQSVDELLTQALDALQTQSLRNCASPKAAKKNFAQFLLESPLPGSGLEVERQKDYPRPVAL